MTFSDSIQVCFKEYAKFSGRASRSEYWWFQLAYVLMYLVFVGLAAWIGYMLPDDYMEKMQWMTLGEIIGIIMFIIVMICPMLAVTIRRLHDSGHSGWWYLIGFVPLIGSIWLLVLLLSPSEEENRYGYPVY